MTMAYIIFVNPDIHKFHRHGQDGLAAATILAAAITTILMGLVTNYPFALASGMGLNAYFAFTVARSTAGKPPWEPCLFPVLSSFFWLCWVSLTC